MCGDFNVAPEERDVWDPKLWRDKTLFSLPERAALKRAAEFGLEDTFRKLHPEPGRYSWWDYRMLGFQKNRGLRLDHIYVTAPLLGELQAAGIDREARKGTLPSPRAGLGQVPAGRGARRPLRPVRVNTGAPSGV